MRPLPTAVSALAIALLSSGVVRAEQCRPIDTTIVTWFTPCAPNESPVGFCTQGVIASGLLAGTTRFGVQTMTGSDSVTTYSGILTITTKSGRLRLNDYGILTAKGKFSELEQVVSGTGRFKHLTGMLVSQGVQTLVDVNGTLIPGFQGTLIGSLCHFNQGHGGK